MSNFSVIIPVYNEEEIILDVISKTLKFFKNTKSKILIINDGSKDSTKKKLDKIKNDPLEDKKKALEVVRKERDQLH